MADQKLLLGNVRGEQGPAGPNTVSSSTTTSGFENGHVLFNNNGKVGGKKLTASDVGALAANGTAEKAKATTINGIDFNPTEFPVLGTSGNPEGLFVFGQQMDYIGTRLHSKNRQDAQIPVSVQILQAFNADGSESLYGIRSMFKEDISAFRLYALGQSPDVACYVEVAGRVVSSSSERYKTEIQPVAETLLDAVLGLDVIDFLYNEAAPENVRDNKRHFGVIAEQVAKIMPDSVTLDGEGLPSAVVYSDFIPLLLAQLQRQQKQLAALEQRIRQLEEGNRE